LTTPNELGATFVKSGKVKDIYTLGDDILFHFTDRVSAFDVILPSTIPKKGEVLCKFAEYWFKNLPFESHMIKTIGKDMMLVKKLEMLPIESIVRGYVYGSLWKRIKDGEINIDITDPQLAQQLPAPLFDPTTKHEVHDVPITQEEILKRNWMDNNQLEHIQDTSIQIYNIMVDKAKESGFMLADLKLEFGILNNKIVIGDSIGPDEFRLWPSEKYVIGASQESFDKQPIRDWLVDIKYKEKLDHADKNNLKNPPPPVIPPDLISEVTRRYIFAYEKLTGLKF